MSSVIQVGTTPEGFPIFGYAPEPSAVPAQVEIRGGASGPLVCCTRPDCVWWEPVNHTPLTEIVAQAREHVEEAHRDRSS